MTVDWPASIGLKLMPLTLVPPDRLAQVLGIVATIVFALVLSAWADAPRRDRRMVVAVAFGLTALATALGGRTLREEALPRLSWAAICVVAVLLALAVAVAIWRPERPLALAALPLLALLAVVAANPLQQGLGDLRGSRAGSRRGRDGPVARRRQALGHRRLHFRCAPDGHRTAVADRPAMDRPAGAGVGASGSTRPQPILMEPRRVVRPLRVEAGEDRRRSTSSARTRSASGSILAHPSSST